MCLVSTDSMILKMECQKDCLIDSSLTYYHVQNDRSIYPIILAQSQISSMLLANSRCIQGEVPGYMARKSRRTLQSKVRLKVLPEQLTLFVNTFVAFKNASFNSFLSYRPDYCSEIHAFSYCSNEKYRYKP